jgi:hypothetical protein
MKNRILTLISVIALVGPAVVNAAPKLIISSSGQLTGAQNVNVGGVLYDVTFAEGTCAQVFGNCDSSSFTFSTIDEAVLASQALLDQVFVDVARGVFDSDAALTFGCDSSALCVPLTAYSVPGPFNDIGVANAQNRSPSEPLPDRTDGYSDRSFAFDTSANGYEVYAKWSLTSPEGKPSANFLPLDLSGIVNSDLTWYTFGQNYPAPGSITIAGIPFELTDGGNGNTWVVGGLEWPAATYSVDGLKIANATKMYVIINSAFGVCGVDVGSIGVSGVEFTLTEGRNVRDHFIGGFCNVQTEAIATQEYGDGVIFDVYEFDLSEVRGPISEFTFENFGKLIDGSPLVAAVTFETASVPGVVNSVHVGGPDVCSGFGLSPGCDANMSISAVKYRDGSVNGTWVDVWAVNPGDDPRTIIVDLDCLHVNGNEAWVAGEIVGPDFAGIRVGTRVVDNGVTANDDPDSTSFMRGFSGNCASEPDFPLAVYEEGQVIVR